MCKLTQVCLQLLSLPSLLFCSFKCLMCLSMTPGKACAAEAWDREDTSLSSNSAALSTEAREVQSWYWDWRWAASHKRQIWPWWNTRWRLLQGDFTFSTFWWSWAWSLGVTVTHVLLLASSAEGYGMKGLSGKAAGAEGESEELLSSLIPTEDCFEYGLLLLKTHSNLSTSFHQSF